MEFDVFVSHASEDKDQVVRPLVERLTQLGLRVWLDEFELSLGDSLRRSIDKGLSRSHYGLVVLSPSFFTKEWPNKELDGLVSREDGGGKVILPVWHNVSAFDVARFSPMLADKVAISTARGLDAVAASVLSAVRKRAHGSTPDPSLLSGFGAVHPSVSVHEEQVKLNDYQPRLERGVAVLPDTSTESNEAFVVRRPPSRAESIHHERTHQSNLKIARNSERSAEVSGGLFRRRKPTVLFLLVALIVVGILAAQSYKGPLDAGLTTAPDAARDEPPLRFLVTANVVSPERYKFGIAIVAGDEMKKKIKAIHYKIIDQPTFKVSDYASTDENSNFAMSYVGVGAVEQIVATTEFKDGSKKRSEINMIKQLGWE